ncbi:hypothetical protein BU23DRAFT_257135 [Bimuria novae-zelandiae CBS 107.79]|uniref:Uncharacterized protein n=1 Tax=Bimuria novae-zelandiae CBS 107.79 TaxID=1447943 RepID=A0A6A5UYF5_9PLEO|nr:hypothetical protein BU23DRAFT_257135 [Bimuria novae-zelandiae CBS 107.79]
MFEDSHLLDSTVELLAPFGLQPHLVDGKSVRFGVAHLASSEEGPGLRISRYAAYGCDLPPTPTISPARNDPLPTPCTSPVADELPPTPTPSEQTTRTEH